MKSFLVHLRPRSWPIVAFHYGVGYLIATGWKDASTHLWEGLLGALLWAVFLNGGTLALNSAFDRDEGAIGYLDHPPTPPRGLAVFSLFHLTLGLAGSWLLPSSFRLAYLVCFVLSLLYSCPPARLKSRFGADLLVNAVGYGFLTVFAGTAVVGGPSGSHQWIACSAFGVLFAAFYPLTQIYQIEEDRQRGDRTFALILGAGRALQFSLVCVGVAFLFFFWASMLSAASTRLWIALLPPFLAWTALLIYWLRHKERYDGKSGMYLALKIWALTDASAVFVFSA